MTAESFKKYMCALFEMYNKLNMDFYDINTKDSLFINKQILIFPALKEIVFGRQDSYDNFIEFFIENLDNPESFKQFCDYLDSRDVTFEEIIIELNSVLVKHI